MWLSGISEPLLVLKFVPSIAELNEALLDGYSDPCKDLG